MRENDYTGSPLDDDDITFLAADADLYEFDPDDEALADAFAAQAEVDELIHVGGAANGAKTLREAAEKLYDFADELITMSENGWELIDDISNGHGTAVLLGSDDDDSP